MATDRQAPGSARQAWVSIGLGILVNLVGFVQAGLDEEFFPRFHFPLLTAGFGVLPVLLGLTAIAVHERGIRGHLLLRHGGTVSAVFLVAALAAQALSEGVVREARFDMTWSLTTYKQRSEDRTSVRLEFTDYPGWTTEIASKDLADHLVKLGTPRVPVVFRVIRDFGMLREFKVIQVADHHDWTYNDHGGWTGNCGWRYALTPTPGASDPSPIR